MMTLQNKIDQSKRFLDKVVSSMDNLQLANSGGKDSLVIYTLAKEIGAEIPIIYGNTTIDPPGTIKYIRINMPETIILQPKESFFKIVERKGLPTRLARFCCSLLKEQYSIGKNSIEGVRADESTGRQGRDYIHCDTRREQRGAQHIYPIYDWTEQDVWDFIRARGLEVAPCYYAGFKRLGCVGCPKVRRKGVRRREFETYPRYYEAIRRAITKGMANNPQWKLSRLTEGDGETAMQWWLSGDTMDEYFDGQTKIDFSKNQLNSKL